MTQEKNNYIDILCNFYRHIKNEKKEIKYILWDTETEFILSEEQIQKLKSVDSNNTRELSKVCKDIPIKPFLLCYKDLLINKTFTLTKETGFKKFFLYLLKESYKYTIVIVAHNAIYDVRAIKLIALEYSEFISNIYCHLNDLDNLIVGYILFKNGQKIWINDTKLFHNCNLEEASGIKKSPVPYGISNLKIYQGKMHFLNIKSLLEEEYSWTDYIKYCLKDIDLLEIAHRKKLNYIKNITTLTNLPIDSKYRFNTTKSGLSKLFISKLLESKNKKRKYEWLYRWTVDVETYNILKLSTIGGLTATCKIPKVTCKKDECIFKLDKCSHYPTIMVHALPKNPWQDKPSPYWKYYVTWVYIKIKKIPKLKEKYQCCNLDSLFKDKVKLLVSQGEEVTLYLLEDYFFRIKELCEEKDFVKSITILNKKHQQLGTEFRKHYIKLFNEKKKIDQASELTQKLEKQRNTIKVILNGGYGKLMQKTYDLANIETLNTQFTAFRNTTFKSNLTGIYIASLGRVLLIDTIIKCLEAGFTFLYCDTDSLTIKANKYSKELFEIFGKGLNTNELGSWSLEGIYKTGYFWNVKKKYILEPIDDLSPHLQKKFINKSLAIAGIRYLPEIIKRFYLEDRTKYKKILKILTENNPCFIDNKTYSITTNHQQTFLFPINIIWDPKKKITHYIKIEKNQIWIQDVPT